MKATQRDFLQVAQRAAGRCNLFFLCGPDEAGASAAAARLIGLLPEPGERVELSGGELRADPVRLVDEARSLSLFGSARHILARVTGEEAHDAVRTFLEMADLGETASACPVLIVATSATEKSRTAKLMAGREDALVAMFHPPDDKVVIAEVRAMADAAGLRLGGDLAERIARGAGMDVRLAKSEVEKLALFLDASPQAPKLADRAAHDAIGATTDEDGLMPLVNVVLGGELRRLPAELDRLRELSLNPVGVALALERRAAQLAGLAAKLEPGTDIDTLLDRQRVFFRDKRDLNHQLRCWTSAKLDRLVPRLADLHRALLANSAMADLLLAQSLTEIARFARPRR